MSIIKEKLIKYVISYITHYNLEMENTPLKILDFLIGKVINDNLIIARVDGILNNFVYKYKNFYKLIFSNLSNCIDNIENDRITKDMDIEREEKNRYDIIIIDSNYLEETDFEISIKINKVLKKMVYYFYS